VSPYPIAIIAIIVAAAASIAYYQFFYVLEVNENPLPGYAEPPETTIIRIVLGASLESNSEFMIPQVATVALGVNNKVRWINEDTVPHTVTTDNDYRDPYSGLFDSRERPPEEGGAFVMPGQIFEFVFTQPGEFHYHHEPHPWIQGTIIVRER
jgi:plastocyanin